MEQKDIFTTFMREKPCMMLVALKKTEEELYASALAKQIDCTYSHVVKVLQDMEEAGLVGFERRGRLKIIHLTDKGDDVAGHIDNVRRSL